MLEIINNRLDDTGEQVWKLKDKIVEITQAEQKKENKMRIVYYTSGKISDILTFMLYVAQKEKRK